MPTLKEYLELIEEDLQDSKETIANFPGPLHDPELNTVRNLLSNVMANILEVLELINDLGAPTTDGLPTTLPAIANTCLNLARDAYTESDRPSPNDTVIGNKVKTISWIVDAQGGYRSKAGIA